jgi:hypothetical protein
MDKLIDLQIQASVLRGEIRAARAALRAHERRALALRASLGQCQRALIALRALLARSGAGPFMRREGG